jgi:NAD(P)-dependent dehydrogenase (short-subunit alcohol dehydrogenase family)
MNEQMNDQRLLKRAADGCSTYPHLANKVAVITGASRGIGAVTARAFAEAGARVALAARDEHALQTVAEEIRSFGGEALVAPTDVGDAESVERLIHLTLERFGRLDAAFNNAAGGGHPPTSLADLSIENFDSALAINLRGVFLSMKYEIPAMLKSGGGAIVNMSSTAGIQAVGGLAGYVSSKHGVIGLTKVAALDYAAQGIRVNAVAPGPILTHHLERAGKEAQRQVGLAVPMGRIGQSDEVASVVVWLCSEVASYITGAALPIDGGKLAGIAPFG